MVSGLYSQDYNRPQSLELGCPLGRLICFFWPPNSFRMPVTNYIKLLAVGKLCRHWNPASRPQKFWSTDNATVVAYLNKRGPLLRQPVICLNRS